MATMKVLVLLSPGATCVWQDALPVARKLTCIILTCTGRIRSDRKRDERHFKGKWQLKCSILV